MGPQIVRMPGTVPPGSPQSSPHSRAAIGGKAAALAALAPTDELIPLWFALTAEEGELSIAVRDAIVSALHDVCPDGRAVAVRSSAADEDGVAHSFAGQLESFLDVQHADVIAHIDRVRASVRGDRIESYRRSKDLHGPVAPPGVLVQRMVRADWAGVAFAADPVTGDRSLAVVAAVRGLGEQLVSGERDADTFTVDSHGTIVARQHAGDASGVPVELVPQIAAMARRVSEHFGAPQDIEWAVEEGRVYLLQSRPITTLGPVVASASGRALKTAPPDAPGQTNPARLRSGLVDNQGTSPERKRAGPANPADNPLPYGRGSSMLDHASALPDAPPVIWDNSNITESYGGIVLPLTFSFARKAYEEVYRAFCRVMAVPSCVIQASDHVYGNMLGLACGRVYYNMLNWYRLIAMLPGFQYNRRFMEQMMGVSATLSEELAAQVMEAGAPSSFVVRARDFLRLSRTLARMIRNHLTLPRRIEAFNRRLNAALATTPAELAAMRPDQCAAYYRSLQRQLLRHWDAPIINDFLAMIFHGVLGKLCTKWIDPQDTGMHNDLIRDVGGVISTVPAVRLREMAVIVARDEALTRTLQTAPVADMLVAIQRHPKLLTLYQDYLARFADRCLEELKLESATLEDDPTTLLRSVGHMAQRLRSGAVQSSGDCEARARAEAKAHRALRLRPIRRVLFAWVARNARNRIRDRENLRFERTRVFGRVRRVFVEIGARFHERSLLRGPRDIFYLEVDEVLAFIEGAATTTDLAGLVALRQVQYTNFAAQPAPPDRFETRGMVNPYTASNSKTRESGSEPDPAAAGETRRGIGCCAGVVRGVTRVIRNPRGAELRPGEILVAERTDPGWVMLFPAAAGILVERGSLLSHSAIVSRELGIPGVVSIPGLTAWLRDGDEVELDGSTGVVRRLSSTGTGA